MNLCQIFPNRLLLILCTFCLKCTTKASLPRKSFRRIQEHPAKAYFPRIHAWASGTPAQLVELCDDACFIARAARPRAVPSTIGDDERRRRRGGQRLGREGELCERRERLGRRPRPLLEDPTSAPPSLPSSPLNLRRPPSLATAARAARRRPGSARWAGSRVVAFAGHSTRMNTLGFLRAANYKALCLPARSLLEVPTTSPPSSPPHFPPRLSTSNGRRRRRRLRGRERELRDRGRRRDCLFISDAPRRRARGDAPDRARARARPEPTTRTTAMCARASSRSFSTPQRGATRSLMASWRRANQEASVSSATKSKPHTHTRTRPCRRSRPHLREPRACCLMFFVSWWWWCIRRCILPSRHEISRFETMVILVKALKCATKRLQRLP